MKTFYKTEFQIMHLIHSIIFKLYIYIITGQGSIKSKASMWTTSNGIQDVYTKMV